jgi:hypothetical protein
MTHLLTVFIYEEPGSIHILNSLDAIRTIGSFKQTNKTEHVKP